MKRVLVTGGTGFIGESLVKLLNEAEVPVRLLTRQARDPSPGTDVVRGDLLDARMLEPLTQNISGVIHLAGRVHHENERGAAARKAHLAHAEATAALARAAVDAGATRFLYLSSIAVYGSRPERLTEEVDARPDTPYGEGKLTAEGALELLGRSRGLGVAVIRAPGVYGPGMKGAPRRLFDLIIRGRPIPVPRGRAVRALIYVENLAAAILHLWGKIGPKPLRALVADPEQLAPQDFIRRAAEATGGHVPIVSIPTPMLRAAGWIGDVISHLGLPSPVTTKDVMRLVQPIEIDDRYIRRTLGFQPPYGLTEALEKTVAHQRSRSAV